MDKGGKVIHWENENNLIAQVDELDYMVTRKQSVLYNLFDWPSKRYSRLVVVIIL